MIPSPSASDLAHNLVDEYEMLECYGATFRTAVSIALSAIRRALAAEAEVAAARQQIQGHCDRIAAQSVLLAKRAEK